MTDWDDMPPLEDDAGTSSDHLRNGETQSVTHSASVNQKRVYDDDDESDPSDCDEEEDSWQEMDDEDDVESEVKCLFCEDHIWPINLLWSHMQAKHGLDFKSFICSHGVDQIDFIKLINFIRLKCPTAESLKTMDKTEWSDEAYMKPILEDDLLMYDVEDLILSTNAPFRNKEREISYLKNKVEGLQEIIQKQTETMQRMLQAAQANSEPSLETIYEQGMAKKQIDNRQKPSIRTVECIRPEEDEGYFNSYAHFDIHHEMLSDRIRTESYRDAILNNAALIKGKQLLDLGCGTGILSMFGAKAGAIVTAIDMSEVIYQAVDIVRENDLDDSISLRKGRLEDIEFNHKFDFVVSEWMGYFLLFEGMLDSVLYARDKHLAEGGLLLPNRCTMHLTGIEDLESYKKFIAFWDDVYGFKMSCMRKSVTKEATTEVVKEGCLITSADKIADFDLMKIQPEDTEFVSEFTLNVQRDGQLTGLVGYFDTYFELPSPVFFSTGPRATPTHWKQTIFHLPNPFTVQKGEYLKGTISVRRRRRAIRSLDVKIKLRDLVLSYVVE